MRYLPENNLNYPVLVELAGGNGSGFYLNFRETQFYLVTAYHVLYDPQTKIPRADSVTLTSYDQNDRLRDVIFEVDINAAKVIHDASRDTVMVLMADISAVGGETKAVWKPWVKSKKHSGTEVIVAVPSTSLKKFNEVLESNEVFLLGYPSSIGAPGQIEKNRPLLRKGIVAGKNFSNKTVILDCPVYFGNSGGLAIEVEETGLGKRKFMIIGIVTQYIPFIEQLLSLQMGYVNQNMENSGYAVVVPADVIEEVIAANL